MQLQDAFSIPKIFIGLDIHKKSWTVSIQTDLFFTRPIRCSNAEDLYQYGANISRSRCRFSL
jgi:hypothetical protein